MKVTLERLIAEAELDSDEIATVLGLTVVAVINKRAGRRRWSLDEAAKLSALISSRVRRRVSIEKAFEGSGIHPVPALAGKAR